MIERETVRSVMSDDPPVAKCRKPGVRAVIVGPDLGFTIPALWAVLCPELLHSLPYLFGCDVVPRIGSGLLAAVPSSVSMSFGLLSLPPRFLS
jgi:hypothetical protein